MPALRRFNTIAFAIVLLIALTLGGFALFDSIRSRIAEHSRVKQLTSASEIVGERLRAGDRALTLYYRGDDYAEFRTDLRFVDSRTGIVTKLGNDGQKMFGGTALGQGRGETQDAHFGYFVRAKTGDAHGYPLFDVLFLRFSDMRTFKLASNVQAVDENEVDGQSFSAVLWDSENKARFVLFDVPSGTIVISRDMGLKGKLRAASDAAPQPEF